MALPSYKPLEAGNYRDITPESRFACVSRMSWRKGVVAGVIIFGLIWLKTGGNLAMPTCDVGPGRDVYETPPSTCLHRDNPSHESVIPDVQASAEENLNIELVHPTSFETDPDPLSTTYCKIPRASHLPLVQYAVMIDAGSVSTRIHIYKFNNCPSNSISPVYEYETFKQVRPSLMAFASTWTSTRAVDSLDPLLKLALERVPLSLHACTPIAFRASAGLRMLGKETSQSILDEVTTQLNTRYPFPVQSVEILDPREEGAYTWVAANYLLGTLLSKEDTYTVLDLGGASTQIVFEPIFRSAVQNMTEGEHIYELTYGDGAEKRALYQYSHLGYGLIRARNQVHELVANTQLEEYDDATGARSIKNACLTKNSHKRVTVDQNARIEIEMKGADIGSFEGCKHLVKIILGKDRTCVSKPCSFNGVYQPSLLDTFLGIPNPETKEPNSSKVLLLSYFFDRINMLLPFDTGIPMPQSLQSDDDSSTATLSLSTVADLARVVCEGNEGGEWDRHWTNKEVLVDLAGRPEYCLDLTFIHTLLSVGYELPEHQQIRVAKRIKGVELGWCLGATMVELLGGLNVKCMATV